MSGMIESGPLPVSLVEAQAFIRIETGEEEALLAALLRSASAICEEFIGGWLMERRFESVVAASGVWQKLSVAPVRSIDSVELLLADGSRQPLAVGDYAIDLDGDGRGYVRAMGPVAANRLVVGGSAGMASDPNALPEPLRQGILRLTAHFYAHRDGDDTPPAAVTALWKPYRSVRL